MTTKRRSLRARGNFYPTAIRTRDDGRRYAVEPPAPFHSLKAARDWLDGQDARGYVQQWSDRTQSRSIVADRDDDGRWTTTNPYTGEKVELA